MELAQRGRRAHGLISMSRDTFIYTLPRVAMILGISEDLLERIAQNLRPKDGVVSILDTAEDSITGFTRNGVDYVREILADPYTLKCFLDEEP